MLETPGWRNGQTQGLKILQEEKWAFSLKPSIASYLPKN
jgi:hypothetical protein